jgi:2-polyprenyl-3-methyl-5-hydroxy-6-metoxy-1,4-benzoquinol methylase
MNRDLFEWADEYMPRTYPWVLSISTVEHTADPVKAIEVLKDLVAPGGKLLVTFPTMVSDALDDFVMAGAIGMTRACTIARDVDGGWGQTPSFSLRTYGPWANSVFIGEWERPT